MLVVSIGVWGTYRMLDISSVYALSIELIYCIWTHSKPSVFQENDAYMGVQWDFTRLPAHGLTNDGFTLDAH